MAATSSRFVDGSQLAIAAAALYTAGSGKTAIIKAMTLTNTSGNPVASTVHLVPSGGSPTASNRIISGKVLAAGESYTCPEAINQVLAAGGSIQGLADTASAISMVASGVEIS